MNARERAALAARLRAIDHPEAQALARELEAEARPPHRPKDPAAERVKRRVKRALVADAVYRGTLPPAVVPEAEREAVERAKGSRARADAAAAALVYASPRAVERARQEAIDADGNLHPLGSARRKLGPMKGRDTWEELIAYLQLKAPRR